jgi:hypothetical protein
VGSLASPAIPNYMGRRPMLILQYTNDTGAAAPAQWSYPAEVHTLSRTLWVDDAIGDDTTGNGSPLYPFKTPYR